MAKDSWAFQLPFAIFLLNHCIKNYTYSNAHHHICLISEMGKDSWAFQLPFAIFQLNHSLIPPKSCTDVFKPVIIDQLFDNFLFGTSHFIPHLQNLFILCLLHY